MLEFHRKMLADGVRNRAFKEALERVIIPGQSAICDIGAGTGILSFIASKLGAKECHLYEYGGVLKLARRIAEANGIKNCSFVNRHSFRVKSPPKADIVISETIGNFALEEHLLENMNDARARFLKDGGVLIPSRLSQFMAPVASDRLTKEIDTWSETGFGLDWSPAREMGLNNAYVRGVIPGDLLSGPDSIRKFDEIDFYQENSSRRSGEAEWKIAAEAVIYGLAVWWECELIEGVNLSTAPASAPTHWEQIFLPLSRPVDVKAGDKLTAKISSDSRFEVGINVAWDVRRERAGEKVLSLRGDIREGHLD